jgi:hypothetical protein
MLTSSVKMHSTRTRRVVLTEEGLTEDQATRFVVFYEKALGLLKRYDEQGH